MPLCESLLLYDIKNYKETDYSCNASSDHVLFCSYVSDSLFYYDLVARFHNGNFSRHLIYV